MTPDRGERRGGARGMPRSDLILLGVLASVAHLLFSPLGFNPTDDGFVLAMSRRLLEGEVPHRDFISIRPVASAVFHKPLVALGGAVTQLARASGRVVRVRVDRLGLGCGCWAS